MSAPPPRRTLPAPAARIRPRADARQRLTQARGLTREQPLVDAKQAGQLLGVPASWLLAQARAQRVPHHRLGHYVRFDLDELIAWIEQNRVGPR